MKNIYLLIITFPLAVVSQNTGIGTNTPTEKLEIKNALRSTVKISSNSLSDTTQLILSNRTPLNIGTDFSIKSIREEGLYFSSLSDFGPNNSANSLVILPGGNAGVGIIPTSKLHINGGIKLEGLNLFEFGAGVAGKEVNAGKIGYNAFGQNGLTFVGGGTNSSNRAFYFFGEGGTTFSGPATITGNTNIGGQLQVNGSPGTAGQMLMSNGASDPSWSNAAFGNNTRFAVDINHPFGISTGHTLMPITMDYNLNPTNITIGANTFTINQTGLYHFDIYLRAFFLSASSQPLLSVYFSSASLSLDFIRDEVIPLGTAAGDYRKNFHFSVDMHITAPATIGIGNYRVFGGVDGYAVGKLYGHLINQ